MRLLPVPGTPGTICSDWNNMVLPVVDKSPFLFLLLLRYAATLHSSIHLRSRVKFTCVMTRRMASSVNNAGIVCFFCLHTRSASSCPRLSRHARSFLVLPGSKSSSSSPLLLLLLHPTTYLPTVHGTFFVKPESMMKINHSLSLTVTCHIALSSH